MRAEHKSFGEHTSCSSDYNGSLAYNGCIITTGSLSYNLRMQNHAIAWANSCKSDPKKEKEEPNAALHRLFQNESVGSGGKRASDTLLWNNIYVLSTKSKGFYGKLDQDERSTLVFLDVFDIGRFIRRYFLLDALMRLSTSLGTSSTGAWIGFRNWILLLIINTLTGILYLFSLGIKSAFIFIRYFIAIMSIPRLKCIIVMSPPCFPTVFVCIFARLFIKDLRIIVDVHNYAFCMLIPPCYLNVPETSNKTLINYFYKSFYGLRSCIFRLFINILSAIERECYSRCNIILTVSNSMKDDLKARWGLRSCVYRDRPSPENKLMDDLEKHIVFYKYFNGTSEITPLIASFNPNIRESIPSFGSIDSISRVYKIRDYIKKATSKKDHPPLLQNISIASHKFIFESDTNDINRETVDSSILDGIYEKGFLRGRGVWTVADFTREEDTVTTVSLFVNKHNRIFEVLSERLDLLDSSKFKDVVYVEETIFGRLVIISKQNSAGIDFSKRNIKLKIFGNTDGIFLIYKRKKERPVFAITSTSFSSDEDLGMLISAVKKYDEIYANSYREYILDGGLLHPQLILIITGDGFKKSLFKDLVSRVRLRNTIVRFAFIKSNDYFNFVGSADFGISMHTSFSGLDLPIKIITMQGCGLPVISYKYGAVSELVHNRFNGMLFSSSHELSQILIDSLLGFPYNYDKGSPEESAAHNAFSRLKNKLNGRSVVHSIEPGASSVSCFRVFSLSDMIINARKLVTCDFLHEWKTKIKPLVYL
ncbi:hypothetical protein BEWA_012290 [Theileria equi strain WA]|uniref:Beta-1,4-mannosyltransferase n=1 Tax=Theileria equi strain WA TaxID=1537102 RepID=L1LBM4_THEEQ|nr:hypothetical protein BEWA_012290 [Theileria equi strain WA]EKX72670.1 hypothetical protein BEWA_012290 [Theileria equi strain WA]|eukprot:XP_004832122.1 hypothetical protein BEWA_012290 [Theileria equi strain WA]